MNSVHWDCIVIVIAIHLVTKQPTGYFLFFYEKIYCIHIIPFYSHYF